PRSGSLATGGGGRISPPRARAAAARASGSAPIPPRTSPQPPTWPSMFPRRLCARVNAVPGADGPEKCPITLSFAKAALTSSDSKYSSRSSSALEEQAPEEVLRLRAAEKRDQVGDRDGRGEEHRFDEVVDLGPHRLVLRIRRRVFLRELRDFLRGLLAAGPEEKISSIGERAEALWVEGHLPQPELRELEILDDLRAEESRHVRRSAEREARRERVPEPR